MTNAKKTGGGKVYLKKNCLKYIQLQRHVRRTSPKIMTTGQLSIFNIKEINYNIQKRNKSLTKTSGTEIKKKLKASKRDNHV